MGVNLKTNIFELFCEDHGIEHNFSTPRTPQQNEVVKRKNRSLEEIARTLLNVFRLKPLILHVTS